MRISDWSSDVCSSDLRDLAASGLGALKSLNVPAINGEGPGPDVRTEDQEGCPAFFARSVRGVKNGPSPEWLQKRLKAIGQKPISTLVDITNFIMIDLGRPLHVYDMATRSEEHTSELQSLMRISYAVFCLKKNTQTLYIYKKQITHKR